MNEYSFIINIPYLSTLDNDNLIISCKKVRIIRKAGNEEVANSVSRTSYRQDEGLRNRGVYN